jgi:serine/threonine protein kinase
MTELPRTFGKYFLTEKLATGGMAEIYLGKILGPGGFEKQLVLKQIHPTLSDQRRFVDLFVTEAKLLVGLTHGNIVPVYELGVVDDTYFIAMEYIDGPTLYRLTEAVVAAGARITPPIAAWIAARLLDGLDYAHRKGEGVIHRDLSPRNVMLSRDGEVKLVDFGIAVADGSRGDGDEAGAPTGSFPYMSPEQVRRQPLTAASDLFSAGVLLWEMLTGRRLFARPGADETLRAVLEAPIPAPSSVDAAIPARLDEVVAKALDRDLDRRATSAGELLALLNRYLYSLDPAPTARDVAALVARHCPPVPTVRSADGAPSTVVRAVDGGPATVPVQRTVEATSPSSPGDTVVSPRTSARGKGRPPTVRERSFATHVEFERVLLRATPLLSFAAIVDEPAPAPAAPAVAAPQPEATVATPRAARSRRPAVLTAVAVAALAVAAAVAYPRLAPMTRAASPTPTPTPSPSLTPSPSPTPTPSPSPSLTPSPSPSPSPTPTPTPTPSPTARPAPRPAADPARRGRLKVGASPWAEVSVDGRRLGRTPGAWDLPAGGHQVELVFPGSGEPQRKSYPVTIKPGEDLSLFAEFAP